MNLEVISDAKTMDDAQLVELVLAGDREAFGQLVKRYQSSVCALVYSACGDISQSEDLAQETFIIAWRKLKDLKEPAKFRSWLYGIARNLINNSFRKQTRNPLAHAKPLDEELTTPSTNSNPTAQAISKEEEGILWRSLEQIPEAYREPLILFYREQQSIERVAEVLDLSEEATRQRLSRGRKLLHERVIAFVEGALGQSAPGQTFTLGVMAALPPLTITTATSAIGGTALKGSVTGKAAGSTGGMFPIVMSLLIKFAPALVGMWMTSKLPESSRERKVMRKYGSLIWIVTLCYPAAIVLAVTYGKSFWAAHPQMLTLLTLASAFGFAALIAFVAVRMSRVVIRVQKEEAAKQAGNPNFVSQSQPYEYCSRSTFLGLPLLHVRLNCVRDGKTLPAKGWIAIGTKAYGVLFAFGATLSVGCISYGGCAIGGLAIGGVGIGLFAFGGFALGLVVIGGAAIGYMAFGGGVIGWLGASGGATVARHFAWGGGALAEHANDQAARVFMQENIFFRHGWDLFYIGIVFCWLVPPAVGLYYKRKRQHERQAKLQ